MLDQVSRASASPSTTSGKGLLHGVASLAGKLASPCARLAAAKALGIALMAALALGAAPQSAQAAKKKKSAGKTIVVGGSGQSKKPKKLSKTGQSKQGNVIEDIKKAETRGQLNVFVQRAITQGLVTNQFVKEMTRGIIGGNPRARRNCSYAVSAVADPRYAKIILPVAMRELQDAEEVEIRSLCAKALGRLGASIGPKGIDALGSALNDGATSVRREASTALGKVNGKKHGAAILKLAKDEEEYIESRQAHILALGELKYAPAVPALEGMLKSSQEVLRLTAAKALCGMNEGSGRRFVEKLSRSEDEYHRKDVVWILGSVNASWAQDLLAQLLKDSSANVQVEAAKALALQKDRRGVTWLVLTSKASETKGDYEMVNRLEQVIEDAKISPAQRKAILVEHEKRRK